MAGLNMPAVDDRFARMRAVYGEAVALAPALRARFAAAGLSPAQLVDAATLCRLPVLKKEQLVDAQQKDPPFAGYLACKPEEIGHIYVSPGPIFEPSLTDDQTGHGMDKMFAAAGIGAGDIVLNTWSYHLVPAGLLFDRGARAVGATVIPGGVGASELQADLLFKLKVTAFVGSSAFLVTLIERLAATGVQIPDDWFLQHAFVAGEIGDWAERRRALEARYAIKTWSCYGTADFGLIGFERRGEPGYVIHPDRYLQICDPETGAPVAPGEPGEIVVTTLARGWPMIRFGTGDVSVALEMLPDGGVSRIAPLQGRVGAAVKVREIFIYPRHVEAVAAQVAGLEQLTLVVTRADHRDEITAQTCLSADVDQAAAETQLRDVFPRITRLRLDHVVHAAEPASGPRIIDRRLSP
jgi:phenylacetate-CoA ligase